MLFLPSCAEEFCGLGKINNEKNALRFLGLI